MDVSKINEIMIDSTTKNTYDEFFQSIKVLLRSVHGKVFFFLLNENFEILSTSENLYNFFGRKTKEVIGENFKILMYSKEYEKYFNELENILKKNQVEETIIENRTKNGEPYISNITVVPIFLNEEKTLVQYVLVSKRMDISEIESGTHTLDDKGQIIRTNQILRQRIDVIEKNVMMTKTNLEGTITFVSDAFCKATGYSKDELLNQKHNIMKHENFDNNEMFKELWKTINENEIWEGTILNKKKDGSDFWVQVRIEPMFDGRDIKTGYLAIREDITAKKELERMSMTDQLTGIFNRRKYEEVIELSHGVLSREKNNITIALLDIDNFKKYNDTYGHYKGDHTLRSVATRVHAMLHRKGDFVFRVGGEEFAILLQGQEEKKAFEYVCKIKEEIENLNILHKENENYNKVTVSIGFYTVKANNIKNLDLLYTRADQALYEAKKRGRNVVINYSNINL